MIIILNRINYNKLLIKYELRTKMYKRNKHTVNLDLKFIQNKGLYLNVKDLYHLTVERFTGVLLEINTTKNNIKKADDKITTYNLSFWDVLKALELEKYWTDIENKT